jgi:cell division protein FtsI (penicillin-binding protein 3)/stage V sporulation protein D (sporulation-specific penicillin-binding protein)
MLMAACLVLLAAVVVRSFQLQVIAHASYASLASSEHRARITLHASRGSIVDARGVPLALSEQATTVGVYVPVPDPAGLAAGIAAVLGVPAADLEARMARGTGHIDLVRQVDPALAGALEARHLSRLLTFLPEEKRVYPKGIATQLIGTTRIIDGVGVAGLELQYDHQLRGVDGRETYVQSGQAATISPIDLVPARDGARLELGIDTRIQGAAERAVVDAQRRTRASSVVALTLDARTGAVLAMASSPGPGAADYRDASPESVRLRAIADTYEPGSTFKTATIAAGLDYGVITPTSRFYVSMCAQFYDRRICDAESHPTEWMTVSHILTVSSNVGAVKIAYDRLSGAGPAQHGKYFYPYIGKFGFGVPTGIDLPGERKGDVPDYRSWSGTTIGNIPFGQGLAVTPIQLATFYAMIANHGVWTQPHVVTRIGNGAAVRPRTRRMLSTKVANQLNAMLRNVVATGTGVKAAIPGYTVAGKTGTTQKVVDGTYSDSHFIGWFAGFAPARNPRVVTVVLVDDPSKGSYYGGDTAAPVFADLTARALQALGVPRSGR